MSFVNGKIMFYILSIKNHSQSDIPMLITADQIRAARALKNWSQTDLAERTGLAVPTIANIELGKQIPGKNTIEKIIDAFKIGEITFTPHGVEFDRNEIVTLSGWGKFKNLLIDVLRTLEDKPAKEKDFLIFSADDSLSTDEEIMLYDEMHERGIVQKRIISSRAKEVTYLLKQTKEIDPKYFDDQGAIFLYGNKLAFYTAPQDGAEAATTIITNERIATTFKKIFAFMWDNLKDADLKVEPKKKGRK